MFNEFIKAMYFKQIGNIVTPFDQNVIAEFDNIGIISTDSDIDKADKIYSYMIKNYLYKEDKGKDTWQLPHYTIKIKQGDCFTGDTRIIAIDKNGYYCDPTLSEIGKDINNYCALSYNMFLKKWEFKPILNFFDKGKRDIVSLHLNNGNNINLTNDHKILTTNLKKVIGFEYKELSNIKFDHKGVHYTNYPVVAKKSLIDEANQIYSLTDRGTSSYVTLYSFDYRKDLSKVGIRKPVENGIDRVYDIEVADNHNFVLSESGLIVHNCEDLTALAASFYDLAGIKNNMILIEGKKKWKEDHVSNVVYIDGRKILLDASYPHDIGDYPHYANDAKVYYEFSPKGTQNYLLLLKNKPLIGYVYNYRDD